MAARQNWLLPKDSAYSELLNFRSQETRHKFFAEMRGERDRIEALPLPGRTMDQEERRRNPRYTFSGSIEMRQGTSEDKITAKVRELSLNGCYVETVSPYPMGMTLTVKVFTATEFFEAQASVIYVDENQGMGLMFRETKPYYIAVLRKWLLSAMIGKKVSG
jgi:hypothetical protein